jgi:hypothetical protein
MESLLWSISQVRTLLFFVRYPKDFPLTSVRIVVFFFAEQLRSFRKDFVQPMRAEKKLKHLSALLK